MMELDKTDKRDRRMASSYIHFEEVNNDLYDEVELYHANDRKLSSDAFKKRTTKQSEEVLNVEGDLSGDSELSESDFDDDGNNSNADCVIDNKWGHKKKNFYGTEYVDEDWGGMRDEELDDAELEEEDAVSRQAALDKAASFAVDLLDDVDYSNTSQAVVKEIEPEWKLSTVRKMNKRTTEIIEEYTRRKNLMKVVVEPLIPVIDNLPKTSIVRKQLMLVFDVYATYIMNMLFFLRMKADSLAKRITVDEVVDSHPVLDRIERFKKMVKVADAFLDKNSSILKKLINKVSLGESVAGLVVEERTGLPSQHVEEEGHEISTSVEVEEKTSEQLSSDGRRKASKKIEKNTMSVFRGRKKKDPRIAKTKNRKKYKEAVKKVHSQIGTMRKEMEKYTGESRGIRISTVRSTKLIV